MFVSGRVQGVGFRWSTQDRAQGLGLRGWVRNLADGRVEAWLEGSPECLDPMIDGLHAGPPAATVRTLDVSFAGIRGYRSFSLEPTEPGELSGPNRSG